MDVHSGMVKRLLHMLESQHDLRAFLVKFDQRGGSSVVWNSSPDDPFPDTARLHMLLNCYGLTEPQSVPETPVVLNDVCGVPGLAKPLMGVAGNPVGVLVLIGHGTLDLQNKHASVVDLIADCLRSCLELETPAGERQSEEETLRVAVQRYESLFRYSADAIFVFDRQLNLVDMNEAATRLTGYGFAELAGRRYRQTLAVDAAEYLTYLLLGGLMGHTQDGELTFRHKRGDNVPFAVKVTPIRVQNTVTGVFCNAVDVSEQRLMAAQLAESEQWYRALFENTTDAVMVFDEDCNLVRHNTALEQATGYRSGDLLGRGYSRLLSAENFERVQEMIRATLKGEKVTAELPVEVAGAGQAYWLVNTVPVSRASGAKGAYVLARDITAQKRAELQMIRMAYRDALTGLANRAFFHERLKNVVRQSRLSGHKFAVLYLDLDGFKVVNDSLGHECGDLLLTLVSERLTACVRPSDTVARIGGDEFTVLLENIPSRQHAEAVAERLVRELKRPFVIHGKPVVVSASVGVAFSGDGETAADMLRYADLAMYHVKNAGKGRWAAFDPSMSKGTVDRLDLDISMRRALAGGEFRLYYQPVFDLRKCQVVGLETLVRWQHPSRGLVRPDEFIPRAEETGQIVAIGSWVLEHACEQLKQWRDRYAVARSLGLMANLSVRQLHDPELTDQVRRVLQKYQLPPERLVVEITETAMITDVDRVRTTLADLREIGVRIAVDDFGTGYAWFEYLNRFAIDIIKIDRSFIQGIAESPYSRGLVSAIISFAKQVGLTVCAEGIENDAQLEQLRDLHCDRGQGFLFHRPEPPERIEEMLRELEVKSATRQSVGA